MMQRTFFQRDPVTCARELVGCILEWKGCSGVIVETEAYSATNDEACHTWSRPSAREFVFRNDAGAAYVYLNYGMYWMLNVLIKGGAEDGFVLFKALEPRRGIDRMRERRLAARRTATGGIRDAALCSGPGKLAQALAVTGEDHGRDFCGTRGIAIRPGAGGVDVVSVYASEFRRQPNCRGALCSLKIRTFQCR
ncbi:MAG: hypothetical protein RL088_1222 [Verrucomicrobiota bacterium]|jgi:DNA-3-methyladenine glycosylase